MTGRVERSEDEVRSGVAEALAALCADVPARGLYLPDEAALVAISARLHAALAQALTSGPVRVSLIGELGSGKTALVRALLMRFGHRGPVKSPTYSLFETYELPGVRVAHADLYRLVVASELEHTGFDELVADNDLLLVEWAEQGGDSIPPFDLVVTLDYATDGGRTLRLALP